MARFSERIGARPKPQQIQLESMNAELKNSLWNEILERFGGQRSNWIRAAQFLGKYHFKIPVDGIPQSEDRAQIWIREEFFGAKWDGAYDMVEFMVCNVDDICNPPTPYRSYYTDQMLSFLQSVNRVLERELSGYRFVRGILVPVSDKAEIQAIEEASSQSAAGVPGAHEHIDAALRLLGQKPTPDYRNSIKESISAVEAVVNVVSGSGGNGVADALEQIATHVEIHGALKAALKQLYGFSSDADGVRHAIMDQTTLGYDEAKFMLVACAAFVNFILAKATQAGLP
jgi:hypothetical protein